MEDYYIIRLMMQILISLLVLLAALYIIIYTEKEDSKKWAYGMVGSVIGYWFNISI